MRVVAFDAKPFERGSPSTDRQSGDRGGAGVFATQLGVGVAISDKDAFRDRFTAKFAEIRDSLKLGEQIPVCSSNRLLSFGYDRAAELGEQLVKSVRDLIENVHCFFVILPPSDPDEVRVGKARDAAQKIPTWLFLKNMGPMLSYMTAQDYLYTHGDADVGNTEFHIDAFVSRRTRAWDVLVDKVEPKVFGRGDECNPFIACADLMAFLTDAKLRYRRLRLNRQNIAKIWKGWRFDATAHYMSRNTLAIHSWYTDKPIDPWPYVARPTVFLSFDTLPRDRQGGDEGSGSDAEPSSVAAERQGTERPKTASRALAKSAVYVAAARYAFNCSGSFKLFHRYEDRERVHDHDVFVYVGPESEKIGRVLQDASRVKVMSGLELRDEVEKIEKKQS